VLTRDPPNMAPSSYSIYNFYLHVNSILHMKHVGASVFRFHTKFHLSCCTDLLLFVVITDEAKV
jgi:hypothetical protein